MKRVLTASFLLSCFAFPASAHEVRPAYLQIHQTGAETYDVFWKVPARGQDLRLGLYVQLADDCETLIKPRGIFANGAYTEQWSVKRAGGLSGSSISISGLSRMNTDVLARFERLDGTTQVTRLTPSSPSFLIEATPQWTHIAGAYMLLGIEHILTGFDHLLYILSMLLLVKGWKRIIGVMTAFTLTHSLTLTAAALGWVNVPSKPVEACIALSILFVTSEIVRARQGFAGLTQKWPWVISFSFGLLHGFGFAGALSEVGLPERAIPVALLCFNIGVEIGQLLFVAAFFAILLVIRELARRVELPQPTWLWRVPPYAIGSVAAFWFIQRLSDF